MLTLTRDDGYTISTDRARLDLDLVHTWLCRDAYWALGRDRETVTRAFTGSIGFGVYRPADGRQVAVARVVTVSPLTSKDQQTRPPLTVEP